MGALTLSDLSMVVDQPRVSHVRLADVLGFQQSSVFRNLIERHLKALERLDGVSFTVNETPSPKGGRPGRVYWLSKKQALFVCTKSETAFATEATIQMIEVFDAWMEGRLAPVSAPDPRAEELEEMRARPVGEKAEIQRERRLAAMVVYEQELAVGAPVTEAVRAAAQFAGCGVSTFWHWLCLVRMVPEADRPVALTPQYVGGGRQADIHPEAWLMLTTELARKGARVSDAIARVRRVADAKGWSPIPCDKTLQRRLLALRALSAPAPAKMRLN